MDSNVLYLSQRVSPGVVKGSMSVSPQPQPQHQPAPRSFPSVPEEAVYRLTLASHEPPGSGIDAVSTAPKASSDVLYTRIISSINGLLEQLQGQCDSVLAEIDEATKENS